MEGDLSVVDAVAAVKGELSIEVCTSTALRRTARLPRTPGEKRK